MKRNVFIILILFFLLICAVFIYKYLSFTYITAKFTHLRPIHTSLKVYYKGLVIGKAKESKHSDNFHHTLMKIILYPKNLHLPSNTTIALKKEKINNKQIDFLELIYPKEPKNTLLSNGSIIEGYATVDTETYLANQHPDDIETIKQNLIESSQNLNYALQGLGQIFETLDDILKENQNNIYKTTKNIENMTYKTNNAIKQKQLENMLSNVENSTIGISKTIDNLNNTFPNVDNSLIQTKETICNLNKITCGIRKTLSKNFGLMRLFFGRPIN